MAVDGRRAALGLAHHAEQTGFGQHLARELVHARGGGGSGGADDFVAHRVDRADVVDEAVAEVDGQLFAAVEHVGHALVRGVAAGEQLAGEQQHFAGLPGGGFGAGHGVEIHAARSGDVVGELRPVVERGRIEKDGAGAVEHDVRVAGGGAVGNHGHGQIGGVGGRIDAPSRRAPWSGRPAPARRCRGG